MRRILAIETDPRRVQALVTVVREHVEASLLVVASVRAAIASIQERTPDLLIAPALLSPPDETELLTHMKGLGSAPYIQMLTLPALDLPLDAQAATQRWDLFGPARSRLSVAPASHYDPGMVAAEIEAALARARELRLAYAATLAVNEAMDHRAAQATSLVLGGPASRALVQASAARVAQHLRERAREERRVASRKGRGDVPWLAGIKVSWGAELELINISSTGVLVETAVKFVPGSTTNLQLCGHDTNLVVPVRFIRSDVARIDGVGVRYRAAAAFAKQVDLDGRGRDARTPAPSSQELATLFGAVLSGTGDEPAHAQFARGLQQLVGARDVRVNSGPAGFSAGRGTLSFDVPGDARSHTTLRVTFDQNHDATDAQLRTLKAAAWLTAAVLELEKPSARRLNMRASGR